MWVCLLFFSSLNVFAVHQFFKAPSVASEMGYPYGTMCLLTFPDLHVDSFNYEQKSSSQIGWEPDGIVENQLASVANNKSHCDRARLLIFLKRHLALHLQLHTPGHCSINMKLLFFLGGQFGFKDILDAHFFFF